MRQSPTCLHGEKEWGGGGGGGRKGGGRKEEGGRELGRGECPFHVRLMGYPWIVELVLVELLGTVQKPLYVLDTSYWSQKRWSSTLH